MQNRRGRLVGVVDDDAAVRDSLRFLLEASGFQVVEFSSAGQFLAAPAPETIGCLLVDQHMPNLTGLELLQQLQGSERELPVALMTGSPSPQLIRRALELGATAVLDKPLIEQALFRFLQDAIG